MLDCIKSVYTGGVGEITEKKSRFIATIMPVETEEEALSFIESLKKKYYNATHNCSAYVIGQNHEIMRCNDDGEPSGTAGKPMLDVLLGEDIHNTAVVVTRYFGGTLLGTGGLIRAYSKAVQEGLKESVIITKQYAVKLRVRVDYNGIGKVQYIVGQHGFHTLESEYTDVVLITVLVPYQELEICKKEITEATYGQAAYESEEYLYFAKNKGEVLLFS